jgi:hypothetical protein
MYDTFERYVSDTLRDLKRVRIDTLLKRRYEKLRNWGSFFESVSQHKRRGRSKRGAASSSKSKTANGGNGSPAKGGPARPEPAETVPAIAETARPAKSKR